MRGHFERPHLHQAQPAPLAVWAEELVDAELGPMGVAGDVDQEVAEQAIDHPRRGSVAEGVDLRDFYRRNHKYFWSLVALFEIGYVALGVHFLGSVIDRIPRAQIVLVIGQWTVLIAVPVVLALVSSRKIHYAGVALLFAVVFWHYASAVIT